MMSERYLFSILVPTQIVGLLIGKNGAYFRDMSKQSSSKLFLQSYEDMPENCRERVLIVSGNKLSIVQALGKVFGRIRCRSQTPEATEQESTQLIKWVIPQSLCGPLIGRGGEGIKKINELSGSWVKVAHLEEFTSGVDERLVYIRGTPHQNSNALQIIINKVGGRPFHDGERSQEPVEVEDDKLVLLPFLSVPSVLSEIGTTEIFSVENVISIAGASIYIDPDFDMDATEARVRIAGTKQARSNAKAIVLARLQGWREERGLPAPPANQESLTGPNGNVDESAEYCLKFLIAGNAAEWLISSADSAGENILHGIQYRSNCYIQILPSTTVVSNTFASARKVAIIGPTYEYLSEAMGMLLDFIHVENPDAMPRIPVQLAIKKKQIPDPQQSGSMGSAGSLGVIPIGPNGQPLTPRQHQEQMVQAHLRAQSQAILHASSSPSSHRGSHMSSPSAGSGLGARASGYPTSGFNVQAPPYVPQNHFHQTVATAISVLDEDDDGVSVGSAGGSYGWTGSHSNPNSVPHSPHSAHSTPRFRDGGIGSPGGGGSVGSAYGYRQPHDPYPQEHVELQLPPHRMGGRGGMSAGGRQQQNMALCIPPPGSPVSVRSPHSIKHKRHSPLQQAQQRYSQGQSQGHPSLGRGSSWDSQDGMGMGSIIGGNISAGPFHTIASINSRPDHPSLAFPGGLRDPDDSRNSPLLRGDSLSPHMSSPSLSAFPNMAGSGIGPAGLDRGVDSKPYGSGRAGSGTVTQASPRSLMEPFSYLSLVAGTQSAGSGGTTLSGLSGPSSEPSTPGSGPRSRGPSMDDFQWSGTLSSGGLGQAAMPYPQQQSVGLMGVSTIAMPKRPNDFAYVFGHNFGPEMDGGVKHESEFHSDDDVDSIEPGTDGVQSTDSSLHGGWGPDRRVNVSPMVDTDGDGGSLGPFVGSPLFGNYLSSASYNTDLGHELLGMPPGNG